MIFIKAVISKEGTDYTYYWTGSRFSMKRENALEFEKQVEAEEHCAALKRKCVMPYEVDRDHYEYGNKPVRNQVY